MEGEQQKLLDDSLKVVKEQAFYMKRHIDSNNLNVALDHATEMLRELRTNVLAPKNYYELYMKVVQELRELEEYLYSLQRTGKSMVQLYEQVQSCGNVLPRLYLLCCVGSVYISSLEAPAKDILKDMVEMIKGVQHPMRGLFLRYYLSTASKNKLPDVGSPFEGNGGRIQDAYSFLLQNFTEANRLWVRLQLNTGDKKDKKRRERERLDLKLLVGTNLVRLSQLEGLDVTEYKQNVLPKIIEEVVACKDTIAQSYLMDCVIQVFPDEYHIATLEQFLDGCILLKERVQVRTILESMCARLESYFGSSPNQMSNDVNAFKLFNTCVTRLIEERTNMSLTDTLRLETVLLNFAIKCYPSKMEYVAHCYTTCSALIDKTSFASQMADLAVTVADSRSTDETTLQIEELLSSVNTLGLKVLEIAAYSKIMSYLPWGNWKVVSVNLLKSVLAVNAPLCELEQVEQIFSSILPLLRDKEGHVPQVDGDGRELPVSQAFKDEQHLVARTINLMKNDDTDILLRIYVVARTQFTNGGAQRIQFTCAPLVFGALALARRVHAREKAAETDNETPPQFSARKVFQFVIELVTALAQSQPEQAMKLFLQSTQAADDCGFHAIAYEFVKEALLLYECEISDSKSQVRALTSVIGTLVNCKSFPVEDYVALITKVAQYANKLLKKPDQCRMITLSSHLFYSKIPSGEADGGMYVDSTHLLECLQRALKIASVCNPNLFVEILDRYIYYYEQDTSSIQARYICTLIALVNEQLGSEDSVQNTGVEGHYRNTIQYIKLRQSSGESRDKFSQITL